MGFTFVTQVVFLVLHVVLSILAKDGPVIINLDDAPHLFENFIRKYNRTYKNKEDRDFHYKQFKINIGKINDLNVKLYPEHYALNEFSDYSKQDMINWLSNNDW